MTEWWYWEAAAFVAGRLGPVALAAHAVAYNVIPLAFMVPLGISIGTTTRQGNLLGEGKPEKAWMVAKYSLLCGSAVVITVSVVLQHSATYLVPLFSKDEEVVAMAYVARWSLSIYLHAPPLSSCGVPLTCFTVSRRPWQ
jgi:MATE family multidrug resistance protein